MRLVGREAELRALEAYAGETAERGPGSVLVVGGDGVGKSALVAAFVHRQTAAVRWARAAAWETARPYGVLDQLVPDAPMPGALDHQDPYAAAASLAEHLRTTQLLVVEDAHWADAPSLQALSSLTRHRLVDGLLVVLVARDSAVSAAVPAATADLLRHAAAAVVTVPPLGPEAVRALAAAAGRPIPPWAATRLARHTGGRTRHVLALLDEIPPSAWEVPDLRLPAPAGVTAEVRETLARLPQGARALAVAVAVLARPDSMEEIRQVADVPEVLAPLDEAARAGLVRRSGGRFGPVAEPPDPLLRAAVLDAVGPQEAAAVRCRAAEVVDDPARRLGFLATATPGRDAALADRLHDAARTKADAGAWAAVADLLTDASRLSEDRAARDDRLLLAVDARVAAGDGSSAEALVPVLETLPETPLRNAVLGYLAVVLGRGSEAGQRLDRAWELVDPAADPASAALVAQRQVLHALARCRGDDLVTWADRTAALAGAAAPAAVEAAAIRGLGHAAAGRIPEAVAAYDEVAAQVRRGAQRQRVTMGRGWLALIRDDVDAARVDLEGAVPTSVLGGSSRISLWALAWLARLRFRTGEWDAALRAVEQGLALAERTRIRLVSPLLSWTGTQIAALRGDRDEAERLVRAAESGPLDYEIMRIPTALARAQLAESVADHVAVLRVLEPLTLLPPEVGVDTPGWWPWADGYASALLTVGRVDDVEPFLRPREERAREQGATSTRARLGCVRGRLTATVDSIEAARPHFELALELLDPALRFDRAQIQLVYGQTLRRAGKRRDADAVLSVAREAFLSMGAAVPVARCDRELKAGGVHAVRTERPVDALTAQELAVTDLVSRGLTNREVAAQLHVSPKTVQYHLTHVYAKLGVRSRAELAARGAPADHLEE